MTLQLVLPGQADNVSFQLMMFAIPACDGNRAETSRTAFANVRVSWLPLLSLRALPLKATTVFEHD